MAKGQTKTEQKCPQCNQNEWQKTQWPLSRGGTLLLFNGVFFFLVFAWYFSGALVPDSGGSTEVFFLNQFRLFLPSLVGFVSLGLGYAVLTKRISLGTRKNALLCSSCSYVHVLEKSASTTKRVNDSSQ